MRQPKKHLFFINGPVATAEQEDAADELNGFVCFRNANMITPEESCEPFDFVHGEVPLQYRRAAEAKERGEVMEAVELHTNISESETDNGDGTKTTTTQWRPNVGASA